MTEHQQQYDTYAATTPGYGPTTYVPPMAPPPPAPPRNPKRRKRILGWTIAGIAVAAVVGVIVGGNAHPAGSGPRVSPSLTPSVQSPNSAPNTPTTPTPSADSTDAAFLAQVHDQAPEIADSRTDEQLITAGHAACNAIDAGNSPLTVAQVTMNSTGASAYQSGVFVGSAIAAYCPNDMDKIPGA